MKKLTLTLLTIAMLASYSLTAQIGINTDGSSPNTSAVLDVKSTEKGFLPPRLTISQISSIPNPATGLLVYNSETNDLNFFNGSEWVNTSGEKAFFLVGDYYQGGVIFYLDGSGGGLICAITDQDGGSGIQWHNGSNITTGATGTAIGTGQANTTAIISAQGAGTYAASVCDEYSHDGYSDWFLPSRYELTEVCANKDAINATAGANGGSGFQPIGYYFSSTELDAGGANRVSLNLCGYSWSDKGSLRPVRAIRAF